LKKKKPRNIETMTNSPERSKDFFFLKQKEQRLINTEIMIGV